MLDHNEDRCCFGTLSGTDVTSWAMLGMCATLDRKVNAKESNRASRENWLRREGQTGKGEVEDKRGEGERLGEGLHKETLLQAYSD